MKFSPLIFDLPPVDSRCVSTLHRAKVLVETRAKTVGERSPRLNEAVDRLRSFFGGVAEVDVSKKLRNITDVKALAKLFSLDNTSFNINFDNRLIESIEHVSPKLSQMTLRYFIDGFLLRYDKDLSSESLVVLGGFIQKKLASLEVEGRKSDLRSLAVNRQRIFTTKGPELLVIWSRKNHIDLQDAFKKVGLNSYSEGRYFQVCRSLYYLEELRSIPVGEDHKILGEIRQHSVYSAPGISFPTVGHEALAILIDQSTGRAISDVWLNIVLELAGDPRVPETSASYRKWWTHLGNDRITVMRGWLSRLDLKLFLKVLEDYGRSSGDTNLQRMYPSRKRFLEGLLEQGLVTHSRLYINPRAEYFLKRSYDKDDLPQYAKVKDSYRSMIYLNVGGLHMIEGSHSFKLWVFPKLPDDTRILDPLVTQFNPGDLSAGLNNKYFKAYPRGPVPAEITHRPQNFAWQHAAINYLRDQGIKIDIEKLFSKQDYTAYKKGQDRRYGY